MFRTRPTIRRGFTIIELMVVITVITLMMSLLVATSYRFIVQSREAATATTIMKASGIIDDRVKQFRESDFTDAAIALQNAYSISDIRVAEIMVRKFQFKQAFPQAFLEINSATQQRLFGQTVPPSGGTYNSKYESGIILYAVLLKGTTFGAQTPGDDTFTSAEIKNTPETGNLPCLVDAWGEPLRFYRWPTRLIKCGENGMGDYNANGSSNDPAGPINLAPGATQGAMQASPAIRPTGTLLASTPASLLINFLPPFDVSQSYAAGLDGSAGVAVMGNTPPFNTYGWPDSDDPENLNLDPDDPGMRLLTYFYGLNLANPTVETGASANAAAFVIGSILDSTQTFYVDAFHDPFTFSSPLIVSGGPDRRTGLNDPTDIPTAASRQSAAFGYLAAPQALPASINMMLDNITNRNQKTGGK